MTRKSIIRTTRLTAASFMALLFGFPGVAMANQASINTTGPDSVNKIEFQNRNECNARNDNNVGVKNSNFQNASSGNAVVGSDWNKYDPVAWQARGYSYDQWRQAVSSRMAEYERDWGRGGGGGNTIGGDATSGNASNQNSTRTNIGIDNSDACNNQFGNRGEEGSLGGGNVLGSTTNIPNLSQLERTGENVLGSSSYGGSGGEANQLGTPGVGGYGGSSSFYPTTSGGGAGGSGGGPGGSGGFGNEQGGVNNFSIDTTGPDSINKIISKNTNTTNVNNNNNVNVVNVSKQNAGSGNATVSGNTNAGSSGSGGANNSNGTGTGVGLNN